MANISLTIWVTRGRVTPITIEAFWWVMRSMMQSSNTLRLLDLFVHVSDGTNASEGETSIWSAYSIGVSVGCAVTESSRRSTG